MRTSNKALLLGAAISGLMAGTAVYAHASNLTPGHSVQAGRLSYAGSSFDDKDKHACKGQNDCKGKGGCKPGDNGCKGKNSCKGKGGCNTANPMT